MDSTARWLPASPRPSGAHQRFKIKFTETGYEWSGYAKLVLIYGKQRELALPAIFLRA